MFAAAAGVRSAAFGSSGRCDTRGESQRYALATHKKLLPPSVQAGQHE